MEVNIAWSGASLDALSPSKRGPSAHRDQTSSLLQPLQSSSLWLTPTRVQSGDQWLSGASQSAAAAGSPLAAILSSSRPPGSFKGTTLFGAASKTNRSSALGGTVHGSSLGSDTGATDSSLLLKHFRKQLDAADAAKASAEVVLQDSSSLDAQFALARLTAAVMSPAVPVPQAAAPTAAAAAASTPVPGAPKQRAAVPAGPSTVSAWQQLTRQQQQQTETHSASSSAQQQQQQHQEEEEDTSTALEQQHAAADLEQALATQRQAHWFAVWRHATRQHRQQLLQEQRLADACRSHRTLKAWACACFGRAHWQDIQQRPQGQALPPQPFYPPLQAAKAHLADQLHHLHLKRAALAGWAAYVAAAQHLQQERQQAVHVQATAAARAVYQVAVADRFWRLRRLHAGLTALRQAALVAARVSCLHGEQAPEQQQQQQRRPSTLRARPAAAAAAAGAPAAAARVCSEGPAETQGQEGLADKVATLLARVAARQQEQGQEGHHQQEQQGRGKRRAALSPVPWLESLRVPPEALPPARPGASSGMRPPPASAQQQQEQQQQQDQAEQQQPGSRLLAEACAQMDVVLAQDDPDDVLACLAALTQQLSVEALSAEGSAADAGEEYAGQQQQQQQEEEEEEGGVAQELRAEALEASRQQQEEGYAVQAGESDLPHQQQQHKMLAGRGGAAVEHHVRASSSGTPAVLLASRRSSAGPLATAQQQLSAVRAASMPKPGHSTSTGHTSSSSSSRAPRAQALKELSQQRTHSRAGAAAAASSSSRGSRPRPGSILPPGASACPSPAGGSSAAGGGVAPGLDTPQQLHHDSMQQQQEEEEGREGGSGAAQVSESHQPCSAAEPGAGTGADTPLGPAEGAAGVPPQLLLLLSAEDAQRLAALQLTLQRREREQQALLSQVQRCLAQQQVLLARVHHARQLAARCGLWPWRRLVSWRAQQGDVAELWREKARLKGVLRGWRALLWARQYQRCARQAAAQARMAGAGRAALTVHAWRAWHTWASARRHAQQGRLRAVLRAWRRRATWVRGAAQQAAAGWARCQLRLALAGWRRVVSAQMREHLLWQLQSDQRAERFWSQHTARRALAAWQGAARAQQQEHVDQLQHQHTWSKVRCWLLEMQAAKAASDPAAAALAASTAAAAPPEQHGAAGAVAAAGPYTYDGHRTAPAAAGRYDGGTAAAAVAGPFYGGHAWLERQGHG